MKPAILDTDILLDILHGRPEIVRKHAQRYREVHKRYTISAVTVAELARGSLRQGDFASVAGTSANTSRGVAFGHSICWRL